MQAVQHIEVLPDQPLDASAVYFTQHLNAARALIERAEVDALAIVMPAASSAHDDWRRALARDLAREYTPKRVNIVGGAGDKKSGTLTYLSDAKGVTGQYCPMHE